ncbi:hypothetical protein MalM25_32010 [Planctomycetes bacterium MalM25]|nr:hypothetical protein MalM25_32010 [Planctomycetes bacterium MalM25]
MRPPRLAILVLIGATCWATAPSWAADSAADPAASIQGLVEGLGHPVYAERRDARRRLRSFGLKAFDALRAAQQHDDPEIAEASRQLLGGMIESWAWPGDSPSARELLAGYGEGYLDGRLECVVGLAKLPLQRGVAPLVRIARFDASDRVARSAAAALIETTEYEIPPEDFASLDAAVDELNERYGPGKRWASDWLNLAVSEAGRRYPMMAWRKQALRLKRAANRHEEGATPWIREQVLWRWLRVALRRDDAGESAEVVAELLELDEQDAGRRLSRALEWACDAPAPETARRLETDHADSLRDKRGLYRRAELALRFGSAEEAERLFAKALAAEAPLSAGKRATAEALYGPTVVIAGELRRRGLSDWARAEYEAAAGVFSPDKPIDGLDALVAWRLADLHYDAARYAEAAAALAPLVAVCDTTPAARERYDNLPQVKYELYGGLPRRGSLKSQARLCRALAAHDAGDDATEQAELLQAIRSDSTNADIAIAMHRVRNPTEDFAKKTDEVLVEMQRIFEQRIWEWEDSDDPERDPDWRANLYNQWAWLVSNTTGDYDKAVRYSRRSLDVNPDRPSLLDTLGRCLFSAGRLDEAIAVQRRAVEQRPWIEVMRRQLDEFEAALAESEGDR